MNIETRINFREEAKSIALYRRDVKQKSRDLYKESDLYMKKAMNKTPKTVPWYKDEDYHVSIKKSRLAVNLRESKKDYARALNVAVGFLRGTPYKKIEHKCNEKPNAHLVYDIIKSLAGKEDISEATLIDVELFIDSE